MAEQSARATFLASNGSRRSAGRWFDERLGRAVASDAECRVSRSRARRASRPRLGRRGHGHDLVGHGPASDLARQRVIADDLEVIRHGVLTRPRHRPPDTTVLSLVSTVIRRVFAISLAAAWLSLSAVTASAQDSWGGIIRAKLRHWRSCLMSGQSCNDLVKGRRIRDGDVHHEVWRNYPIGDCELFAARQ